MKIEIKKRSMSQEMIDSRKSYITVWKQGKKYGTYRTKSLTKYHHALHGIKTMDSVMTSCIYLDIDCPFGKFTEVIAITNPAHPSLNKTFPIDLITLKLKSNAI